MGLGLGLGLGLGYGSEATFHSAPPLIRRVVVPAPSSVRACSVCVGVLGLGLWIGLAQLGDGLQRLRRGVCAVHLGECMLARVAPMQCMHTQFMRSGTWAVVHAQCTSGEHACSKSK